MWKYLDNFLKPSYIKPESFFLQKGDNNSKSIILALLKLTVNLLNTLIKYKNGSIWFYHQHRIFSFYRFMAPYVGHLPMPEDYRLQELGSLTRDFSTSYLRAINWTKELSILKWSVFINHWKSLAYITLKGATNILFDAILSLHLLWFFFVFIKEVSTYSWIMGMEVWMITILTGSNLFTLQI